MATGVAWDTMAGVAADLGPVPVIRYALARQGAPDARAMDGGVDDKAARLDAAWSGLMAAAQAGDGAAYARLLRECTPLVRRVARHRGVQPDRVDDVIQDVLLTVHRARATFDPSRSFAAWLCVIAQRRAIDALRHRGRQDKREIHAPLDYDNHPDPGAVAGLHGGMRPAEALQAAVDTLPEGQRQAIEMLALRQLSLEEAAALTGKTKGALKVNMHRALKTLRARFGGGQA